MECKDHEEWRWVEAEKRIEVEEGGAEERRSGGECGEESEKEEEKERDSLFPCHLFFFLHSVTPRHPEQSQFHNSDRFIPSRPGLLLLDNPRRASCIIVTTCCRGEGRPRWVTVPS